MIKKLSKTGKKIRKRLKNILQSSLNHLRELAFRVKLPKHTMQALKENLLALQKGLKKSKSIEKA